jgi:hypothetical protein
MVDTSSFSSSFLRIPAGAFFVLKQFLMFCQGSELGEKERQSSDYLPALQHPLKGPPLSWIFLKPG